MDWAPDTLLAIGAITRPHGVRGEVKVQLYWEGSDALLSTRQVAVRHEGKPDHWCDVVSARPVSKFVLLRLAGFETMDEAEALRGAQLLVPRSALPPLASDEYYLVDLVGASVQCGEEVIGVVSEVRRYATVDTAVIRHGDGRLLEQPLLDHWIQRVDIENRRVILASTEGLIE